MMPSSNHRIIRGDQAKQYQSWRVSTLGPQYESRVDRLLTEISRDHPQQEIIPKPHEPTEAEIQLQNWTMELKEREAQLAALEEEAVQRGFAHGQKIGYETGHQEAQQERELLLHAAESLDREFEQFKHQLSEKLLDIALLTSKKILADTLALHPENAALLLEQIIESMQLHNEAITLRCNNKTKQAIIKQLGQSDTLGKTRFVEDPNQMSQGFILQHPEGEVDVSLKTRWQRLTEALGKDTPLTKEDLNDE
jgi:flagellar assembly protein FliH